MVLLNVIINNIIYIKNNYKLLVKIYFTFFISNHTLFTIKTNLYLKPNT
jgi:hypothetical protein